MKPTTLLTLAAAIAASALMAGCADYPDDKHPMGDGWRVAHLDHEVSLVESTPLVRFAEDCRAVPLGEGQSEPARWALLHFRRPPEDVYRVVPVTGGMPVQEGQQVYVNVNDCAQPLDKR